MFWVSHCVRNYINVGIYLHSFATRVGVFFFNSIIFERPPNLDGFVPFKDQKTYCTWWDLQAWPGCLKRVVTVAVWRLWCDDWEWGFVEDCEIVESAMNEDLETKHPVTKRPATKSPRTKRPKTKASTPWTRSRP